MLVDLHIHSHFTDSKRSPIDIVKAAKAAGIGLISVCDHDDIEVYNELVPLCHAEGLSLIRGTEIHAIHMGKEFHVLGYDFDPEFKPLLDLLERHREICKVRGDQLIEKMAVDFPEVSVEAFKSYKRNPQNGGWASIDYLIHLGLAEDLTTYIDYCIRYQIKDAVPFDSVKDVVAIIHEAGGKAVLAHPGDMIDNEPVAFIKKIEEMHALGIDGFECFYPSHSKAVTEMLSSYAKKHHLLITAGSDDHGGFNTPEGGVQYYMDACAYQDTAINITGINKL